jgi:hypothetical protein
MGNQASTSGNQNIVIQEVTGSTISISINGQTQEIQNTLAELKRLLENQQAQNFKFFKQVFNINEITEDNFSYVIGKKAFNELLTKELITALKPYSPFALKFLERVTSRGPQWETNPDMSNQAKDIISFSFVGVLGIQLRKLMAIGKEELSETKQRKYIEHCLLTAKRALQLLCFVLMSELWNQKKTHDCALTEDQRHSLTNFFEDDFEMRMKDYLGLLKHLLNIYSTHTITLPLSELAEFGTQLLAESQFEQACEQLQAAYEQLDEIEISLLSCLKAEKQLATVLEPLSFFANYKMVSIKNIGFDKMRNNPPRYLHYYAALGIDNLRNINSERVNYVEDPISTDAILLFKGHYQDSVNLFPFIIDMNALTFEEKAKICFYSCKDSIGNGLKFRFLEDNSLENIVFRDILKTQSDINDLMLDKEKRKQLKLDTVVRQFEEARNTILGKGETDDLHGEEYIF